MFRVALIAYLGLTTILGPLWCCCSARKLFTQVDGSKCCAKSGHQRLGTTVTEHIAHHHHHGHAGHLHAHAPATETSTPDPAPTNHKQDGRNCPCGKHHASLVANAEIGGMELKAAELHILQAWFAAVALLPVQLEFDADYASMVAQNRPADLYGREILRAYQIMRC